MAYTQRPFEVSYYAIHQWADFPARMLMTVLIQALEQTGDWRAIVPMPTSVRGDHRVEIDQLALVQDFLQKPSQLHLTFRVQLIKLPEHLVLGTRLFDVVEGTSTDDAYGGAVAANRAADTLLREVAGWLRGCVSDSHESGCAR